VEANKNFQIAKYSMKRFALYLLLVPLIASVVAGAFQFALYGGDPFGPAMRVPGLFLWLAYVNWLVTALAVAIADGFVDKRQRLWVIAAAGCVSPFLTEAALYGLLSRSWQWSVSLVGFIGAIAALASCLLIDQLSIDRLGRFCSAILGTIKVLRRYPNSADE
jgi:hypothetical protein